MDVYELLENGLTPAHVLLVGVVCMEQGDPVAEQVADVFAGEPFEDQNAYALKLAWETMERVLDPWQKDDVTTTAHEYRKLLVKKGVLS